jgi:hypothetical protein
LQTIDGSSIRVRRRGANGDNQRQNHAGSDFAYGIRGLVIRVNAVAASGLIEESPGRR